MFNTNYLRKEMLGIVLLLFVLACIPLSGNDYWIGLGFNLLMWIALASAWAFFSSLTGYISLGHVVFFGLGSYGMVLMWEQIPIWAALPITGFVTAFFAFIIGLPVLRIRGPYFVILTLGIAELIKNIVLLLESELGQASRVLMGAPSMVKLFYWVFACATLAILIGYLVRKSPRWRLGLRAQRANEEAAETVGIPVARLKLSVLVASAFIVAVVGAVTALRNTYFEAAQVFYPMTSFTMIAMTIIGGGDSLKGPVLGAIFLTLLQEILWANFPELYTVVLGALLTLFMIFVPGGLSGWLDRLLRHLAGRKKRPHRSGRITETGELQ